MLNIMLLSFNLIRLYSMKFVFKIIYLDLFSSDNWVSDC